MKRTTKAAIKDAAQVLYLRYLTNSCTFTEHLEITHSFVPERRLCFPGVKGKLLVDEQFFTILQLAAKTFSYDIQIIMGKKQCRVISIQRGDNSD